MELREILHQLDLFLFGALPYVAMTVFLVVTIQRYRQQSFSYSSLSSQFLENRQHFWGLVPFHYGLLVVLLGHVVAFALPSSLLAWNSRPMRLYVLEVSALVCGILVVVGLAMGVARRLTNSRVRGVTTTSDWILFGMLMLQVASGVLMAIFVGWGSSWFAAAISPYLWSLVKFQPNLNYVVDLPWLVKLHIVSAYALIAFFPFPRLVRLLVVPNMYLWRRTQVVRWYGHRSVSRPS